MNTESRLKVEMALRVRNFLRANPFGEPTADAVVQKFEERVARAQAVMTQEVSGHRLAAAAVLRRAELREFYATVAWRHLREITKAAAGEKPELTGLFRPPSKPPNAQQFRAGLDTVLGLVSQHQALFSEYGMKPGFLEELRELARAYDQAVADGDAARRAHTGARAELLLLAKDLVTMVRQLNGIMLYRIRENPGLGGAWQSARNIAWPLGKPASGTAPEGPDVSGTVAR